MLEDYQVVSESWSSWSNHGVRGRTITSYDKHTYIHKIHYQSVQDYVVINETARHLYTIRQNWTIE